MASYALGCFALLPYMALWRPIKGYKLPLKAEELVRSGNEGMTIASWGSISSENEIEYTCVKLIYHPITSGGLEQPGHEGI